MTRITQIDPTTATGKTAAALETGRAKFGRAPNVVTTVAHSTAAIRHHNVVIDGLNVFVREAGDPGRPTFVLLPGFPSSTRAYIRLIDKLSDSWHVVAVDYPGFGGSDPLTGSPTFDRLAEVTGKAIDALGIGDYAMYHFDFGSPVGMRIALAHGTRVKAIVTQNGNIYADGFGPGLAPIAAWWGDKKAGQAAIDGLLSLAGTQMQWQAGARNLDQIDPEQAHADQRVLDLPGRAGYMEALLWDYQNNPARYPAWQAWLAASQPKVLAVWGKNDPFFIPAGAEAYRRDVPSATVLLLDTGHFALEEKVDVIAEAIHKTLAEAFA
jgi:pimeloyl-ACP methyl ester carboxylesterase